MKSGRKMWGYDSYYRQRCEQLLESRGVVPLSLHKAVSRLVGLRVDSLARRAQIVDFHEWRSARNYSANPESSRALNRYKGAWHDSTQYVEYLHQRFPGLKRWSERILQDSVQFAEEIIMHWDADVNCLEVNGLVSRGAYIFGWDFLFEESHRNGRGAALIRWKSESASGQLVYKPRNAHGELVLQSVFCMIEDKNNNFVPSLVNCRDHSWHEYIPRQPITDPSSYLRRCGKALAVCLLLGTTDLHADNIHPGPQNYPVIIDGETALQLRPKTSDDFGVWEIFTTGLLPTTIGSPLLAAYGGLSGEQGLGRNLEQSYVSFELINADSDAVGIRRVNAILKVAPLDSEVSYVDENIKRKLIIKGFLETTQRLQEIPELKDKLEEIVRGKTFRQVVRGTSLYYALLTAATAPECLSETTPTPFDLLLPKRKPSSSLTDAVAESEINQLLQGDVPYFNLVTDDTGLCWIEDAQGLKIDVRKYGYQEGLNLGARIDWLFGLIPEQLRSALNVNDSTLGVSASSPKIPNLQQYLSNTKANATPNWLWVDSSEPDNLRLVAGGISMLGSLGTAYAIGKIDHALPAANKLATTAMQRWNSWGPAAADCVLRGFNKNLKSQWEKDCPELLAQKSSGDFLTGVLGFLAQLPHDWKSSTNEKLFLNAEVEDGDSLAHGQAGLFAGAMAINHKSGPALGIEIAGRLSVAEHFDQLAWCRGTSGIVAALAANGFLSRTQADDYVHSVKNLTHELLHSTHPVDFSFCHGLSGIISVLDLLYACGHEIAHTYALELRKTVRNRLASGLGYYLAHKDLKEDPSFLNGYGSLAILNTPTKLHPLLPRIRKEARHALG